MWWPPAQDRYRVPTAEFGAGALQSGRAAIDDSQCLMGGEAGCQPTQCGFHPLWGPGSDLGGKGGPSWITVAPMQIQTAQAHLRSGADQRADQHVQFPDQHR